MLSAALILGSVPFAPMQADAAAYQYEFEKGTITAAGENPAEITAVKGASGGKLSNPKASAQAHPTLQIPISFRRSRT